MSLDKIRKEAWLSDYTHAEVFALKQALEEANDVLRSTASIADREGKEVAWPTFQARVHKVLESQHRLMYPGQYSAPPGAPLEEQK